MPTFDVMNRHMRDIKKRQEEKKKGSRKGVKPWERRQFNMSVGDDAIWRTLPLDGAPYVRRFHWPEGTGPKTCTEQIAIFEGKCVYCHYDKAFKDAEQKAADEAKSRGDKYQKKSSRLHPKEVTCLEGIDFRYYHVLPGEKPDEKFLEKCNVEGPEGDPERCEFCAAEDETIAAREFGGHRIWELKDGHLQDLFDAHQLLQKVCVHVDGDGNLCGQGTYPAALLCQSCEKDLIDPVRIKRMASKEVDAEVNKSHKCPHCATEGEPVLISACKSGKHDGVRGSIEDKNVHIHCSGEQKEMWNGTKYEEKKFHVNHEKEPFTNVVDSLIEWGIKEEDAQKMVQPFDMEKEYRPEFFNRPADMSDEKYIEEIFEKQAKSLNKPNPWGDTKKTTGGFGSRPQRSFTRRG